MNTFSVYRPTQPLHLTGAAIIVSRGIKFLQRAGQFSLTVRRRGVAGMSIRGFLAPLGLSVALAVCAGCSSQPDQPALASQEQQLTTARAKEALLEMMRSKAGKGLGWFDGDAPDQMSKMNIEEGQDGWYDWTAAFRFNPSKAIYTFVVRPRPGTRACVFEYKGSFVSQNGRWLATPPELVSTVLQAGE